MYNIFFEYSKEKTSCSKIKYLFKVFMLINYYYFGIF